MSLSAIFADIEAELARADAKHGSPPRDNGTRNGGMNLVVLAQARASRERARREGRLTHLDVLAEERAEVDVEEEDSPLRAELLQEASMCIKWILDIDRRHGR